MFLCSTGNMLRNSLLLHFKKTANLQWFRPLSLRTRLEFTFSMKVGMQDNLPSLRILTLQ